MTDSPFPLEPTAAEAQAAIAEEFGFFGDWSERYQYLIDLGRKLPPFPEEWKTEEHRLLGCQSMVWIVPEGNAQSLRFHAISDSAIVSGLIFLALAFGQVDLLLAALGFLLLPGLLLRDGQRIHRFLVLGIRLRDTLLCLLLLRRGGVLWARLGNRLWRRNGVFRHRNRLGHRRRQVLQLFGLAQGLAGSGRFGRGQRQAGLHRRITGGGVGVALGRPEPGHDEDQRDQQVHQQRQRQGQAPAGFALLRRWQGVSVHRWPGLPCLPWRA